MDENLKNDEAVKSDESVKSAETVKANDSSNDVGTFSTSEPKKGIPKYAYIAGSVALVLVICICIGFFVPSVNNFVSLKCLSPKSYLAKAEKNYCSDKSEDLHKNVSAAYKNVSSDGAKFNYSFEVKVADGVKTLISSALDSSATKSDPSAAMAASLLSKVDSINFDGFSAIGKDEFGGDILLKLNTKEIIKVSTIFKAESGKLYFQIPTIADDWLCVDLTKSLPKDKKDEMTKSLSTSINLLTGKTLSSDDLKELSTKYASIIFDNLDKVDKKEGQKITVGKTSTKCTELTAKVSDKNLSTIATKVLEEAKKDKKLEDMAKSMGISSDDYKKSIDKSLKSIKDSKAKNDELFTFKAWTNSSGEIIGHEITPKTGDFSMSYKTAEDGDKGDSSVNLKFDQNSEFNYKENYTKKNDAKSGKGTLEIKSQKDTFKLETEFDDFKLNDNGFVSGKYKLSCGDIKELNNGEVVVDLDFSNKDKSQTVTTKITAGGLELGTIKTTSSIDKFTASKEPSKAIDASGTDTSAIMNYAKKIKVTTISDNLKSAINDKTFSEAVDSFMKSYGLDKLNGSQSELDVASVFLNTRSNSTSLTGKTKTPSPDSTLGTEPDKDINLDDLDLD